MRIVVQMGFCRNIKEGQLVKVWKNGEEVDRDRVDGKYLTSLAQRHSSSWYLADLECEDGDIIIIEVCTGLRQKGADETRCFRKTYRVTQGHEVVTTGAPRVGKYGFPLIKGRVELIASVSDAEERIKEAEAFLDDEGF